MPEPSPETLQHWNALAAEKLAGWCKSSRGGYLVPPDFEALVSRYGGMVDDGCWQGAWTLPDYAHSLDAVSRLEAIVRERGEHCQFSYVWHLNEWVASVVSSPRPSEKEWLFATAPAHVRLEACLRACGVLE